MRLSGILPLRNGVRLGYPFDLAIRSLQRVCDEVVILVDPTSEDDTVSRVRALGPHILVESPWDMTNHRAGEGQSEIARQTAIALEHATGDWVLSLQADEVLHAGERTTLRNDIARADAEGVVGIELERLYFYGGLDRVRADWTMPLLRLFRRTAYRPDPTCGAMSFLPTCVYPGRGGVPAPRQMRSAARIYHYARVGDPALMAQRVRNLDTFYHAPETVAAPEEVPAYDASVCRKLDTYVRGTVPEEAPRARLIPFPLDGHPPGVVAHYLEHTR